MERGPGEQEGPPRRSERGRNVETPESQRRREGQQDDGGGGRRGSKRTKENARKAVLSALESVDESLKGKPVPLGARKAGSFLLGLHLGSWPVSSIVQYLGRKEGSDQHFQLKMLTLTSDLRMETQDERTGKMLLHTENTVLSLLEGESGVIRRRGFFTEMYPHEEERGKGHFYYTGHKSRRVVLVLDYLGSVDQLAPPGFSFPPSSQAALLAAMEKSTDFISLREYLLEKQLNEEEALSIFFHVVEVVKRLHDRNIVHRDLRLNNIVLHRYSKRVTLTNFCFGQHVMTDSDTLSDQRGYPHYLSPDVLSGKPYQPKPSDMWSLGVVLYIMLYGQLPFYSQIFHEHIHKISKVDYHIPDNSTVSENSKSLVQRLLLLNPKSRLTASELLTCMVQTTLTWHSVSPSRTGLQIVPKFGGTENSFKSPRKERDGNSELEVMLNWVRINSLRDEDELEQLEREHEEDAREEKLRQNTRRRFSSTGQRMGRMHSNYGIGSKREDGDVGCDDDGRSPVMLLSHRAPLYAAIARERHLRCSRGDGPKNKRVRAAPVAPLVPTLQQEDAVLDLSSLARPRKNPGHDIPLSSEEFPRLDSEELQRVFLLPLFQATTGASATTITPVIQRPAESQGNAWTALFQRCTSAIQADDPNFDLLDLLASIDWNSDGGREQRTSPSAHQQEPSRDLPQEQAGPHSVTDQHEDQLTQAHANGQRQEQEEGQRQGQGQEQGQRNMAYIQQQRQQQLAQAQYQIAMNLAYALTHTQIYLQDWDSFLSQYLAEAYMQGYTQFWGVLNSMDKSTCLKTLLSLMTREQVEYLDIYFPNWQQNPEPAMTYLNEMATRHQGVVAVSPQAPPGTDTSAPSPSQSSPSRRVTTTTVATRSRRITPPAAPAASGRRRQQQQGRGDSDVVQVPAPVDDQQQQTHQEDGHTS